MHKSEIEGVTFTPQLLLRIASVFAPFEGTCFLFSGGEHIAAKQSFLFLFPYEFLVASRGRQWRMEREDPESLEECTFENPWEGIRALLPPKNSDLPIPEWVGYFGYEMGAYTDNEKTISLAPASIPEAYLQRSALTLVVDHESGRGELYQADQAVYFLDEKSKEWIENLTNLDFWKDFVQNLPPQPKMQSRYQFSAPLESKEEYVAKVLRAKEHLLQGDIYQVNISQKIALTGDAEPFALFYDLATRNPAPFSAYIRLKDFAIVSSSPERFLKRENGFLETRPIKGTAPRGGSKEEDERISHELMNSAKERAELLMITDLMRNDLGKVSLPGTVKTEEIWGLETYTNVFHLVSTIRSQPRPNLDSLTILRQCFPGGSITGCPKLRAMEIIHELEQRERGIYTGSIGYIAANRDFDFNIAIRTLLVREDCVEVQLGGAIVADSDPEKEYDETLHKGASIFEALGISKSIWEVD